MKLPQVSTFDKILMQLTGCLSGPSGDRYAMLHEKRIGKPKCGILLMLNQGKTDYGIRKGIAEATLRRNVDEGGWRNVCRNWK